MCLGPMYSGGRPWQRGSMEEAGPLMMDRKKVNKKGLETSCNLQRHDLLVQLDPTPSSFRVSQNSASAGYQMFNA